MQGLRLKDAIELTQLDRSTAHRLLACLVEEGFVERAEPGKRYRLGIEAMQLGLLSAGMTPLVDRLRPIMQKLARQTGDTVFLSIRSGDDALCLHREEGGYPIKAFVVEAGTRRPLGVSAAGVAILAQLNAAEVQALHGRHREDYDSWGLALPTLRVAVHAARQRGYSETTDFRTNETAGVGVAFPISAHAYAGLSIAAIRSRMPDERRAALGAQIVEELRQLS